MPLLKLALFHDMRWVIVISKHKLPNLLIIFIDLLMHTEQDKVSPKLCWATLSKTKTILQDFVIHFVHSHTKSTLNSVINIKQNYRLLKKVVRTAHKHTHTATHTHARSSDSIKRATIHRRLSSVVDSALFIHLHSAPNRINLKRELNSIKRTSSLEYESS